MRQLAPGLVASYIWELNRGVKLCMVIDGERGKGSKLALGQEWEISDPSPTLSMKVCGMDLLHTFHRRLVTILTECDNY